MTQIHYLVVYDTATQQWSIDNSTIHAILTEGLFYDVDSGTWRDPKTKNEILLDEKLTQALQNKLNQ